MKNAVRKIFINNILLSSNSSSATKVWEKSVIKVHNPDRNYIQHDCYCTELVQCFKVCSELVQYSM